MAADLLYPARLSQRLRASLPGIKIPEPTYGQPISTVAIADRAARLPGAVDDFRVR